MEALALKTCSRCAVAKPLDDFACNPRAPSGRHSACKECTNIARRIRYANDPAFKASLNDHAKRFRERNPDWQRRNRESRTLLDPLWRQEQSRRHYEKNRHKLREYQRRWSAENKEYRRVKFQHWLSKNPNYYQEYYRSNVVKDRAKTAMRRALRRQATPAWADRELITKAYEACDFLNQATGEWHHVDHIVPLTHPLVCGLHVAHNLQILTASENLRKSNRYEV